MPTLQKMITTYTNATTPVEYHLNLGGELIEVNDLVGKKIKLKFTGAIFCIHCSAKIKKSFAQGYCYRCFMTLAQTDMCIVKPHQCHHHLGTCRDNVFAMQHCFIPHVVYLAVSSGPKVGITRAHQKITRWADQGAISALEVAVVPSRKIAGDIEVELAKNITDKTNWRKMLSAKIEDVDLSFLKNELIKNLPENFKEFLVDGNTTRLTYPVLAFPQKIASYNPEKNPVIQDTLMGIKGQYLVFKEKVINVRTYQGYEIELATFTKNLR